MPTSRVGNHILSHDCSFHTLNQIHFWLCSTKSQIPGTAINDCIQPTHTLKGSRHNTFEPNGGVANALTPTYTSQGMDHSRKAPEYHNPCRLTMAGDIGRLRCCCGDSEKFWCVVEVEAVGFIVVIILDR